VFAPAYRDPSTARVDAVAKSHGLRLVPAVYSATLVGGLRTETVNITPDGAEGPFVVRRLLTTQVASLQAQDTEVQISSGGRRLTDGAVRLGDLVDACIPGNFAGQVVLDLPAPIVVLRGDTLAIGFRSDTANSQAGAAVAVIGHHVRLPDGQRVGSAGDAWAAMLRDDGEFYAVGVAPTAAARDSVNVSSRMLAQRVGIIADNNAAPTSVLVELGNLTLTPPTGLLGAADLPDDQCWFDDVRHIIDAGNRVSIVPVGDVARVIVVGRRERC
jgi:hypothetical protein